MERKIAIIDMDSLAFTIGHPNKVLDEFGQPKRTEDNSKFIYVDKDEKELEESADFMMSKLLRDGEFTHYIAFIKGNNTVQEKRILDPTYKANRVAESPKWWDFVKAYLINKWNIIDVNNIEVDDAVNITRLSLENSYICAIDSDLLGLEGKHYNWRKNEWIITTKEEANYKFWSDMICGTHNNTKGIPGKGKKYTEELFKKINYNNKLEYAELVFSAYLLNFGEQKGIDEFYTNYKLIKILEKHSSFKPECIKINEYIKEFI